MAHKETLITRCSNAEEELMNYAQEADLAPGSLNTHRPQQIKAWNQAQFIDMKDRNVESKIKRRSKSVMAKEKNPSFGQDCSQKGNKEELKFKLKHYNDQILQASENVDVSIDVKQTNVNKQDQKYNDGSTSNTNTFERSKKQRNFSISTPKQKNVKCDKTVEILPAKTSLVTYKQKASRPVKMSFLPITTDFCLYDEQQKLSLKLKQYIKKCSVTLHL